MLGRYTLHILLVYIYQENYYSWSSFHYTELSRLWAFVTIKEALERAADDSSTKEEIERAYSLAMKYQFLTPFTDMTFNGDPNANQTAVQISTLQKLVNYLCQKN